jgi:hypothetical protein
MSWRASRPPINDWSKAVQSVFAVSCGLALALAVDGAVGRADDAGAAEMDAPDVDTTGSVTAEMAVGVVLDGGASGSLDGAVEAGPAGAAALVTAAGGPTAGDRGDVNGVNGADACATVDAQPPITNAATTANRFQRDLERRKAAMLPPGAANCSAARRAPASCVPASTGR